MGVGDEKSTTRLKSYCKSLLSLTSYIMRHRDIPMILPLRIRDFVQTNYHASGEIICPNYCVSQFFPLWNPVTVIWFDTLNWKVRIFHHLCDYFAHLWLEVCNESRKTLFSYHWHWEPHDRCELNATLVSSGVRLLTPTTCVSVFIHTEKHSSDINQCNPDFTWRAFCDTTLVCYIVTVDRPKCSNYNIKFTFSMLFFDFMTACHYGVLCCGLNTHRAIYWYIFDKVILNELVWRFDVVENSFLVVYSMCKYYY